MDKQQWLKLRNETELPSWVYFEYYKDKGGIITELQQFEKILYNLIAQRVPIMNSEQHPTLISFNSVIEKTHKYFNEKFGTIGINE